MLVIPFGMCYIGINRIGKTGIPKETARKPMLLC